MAGFSKPLREWRITLIRRKGRYLGRIEAADAESAIKSAIEQFAVDEAHRSRLSLSRWKNVLQSRLAGDASIKPHHVQAITIAIPPLQFCPAFRFAQCGLRRHFTGKSK